MASFMLWRAVSGCRNGIRKFITKEDGDVNVVAMVVLTGIAVLLAMLFKEELSKLMKTMIIKITTAGTENGG